MFPLCFSSAHSASSAVNERKAVRAAAKGKRISCPRARRIAEENGVPAAAAGRICNEEKIKIRRCALGCF